MAVAVGTFDNAGSSGAFSTSSSVTTVPSTIPGFVTIQVSFGGIWLSSLTHSSPQQQVEERRHRRQHQQLEQQLLQQLLLRHKRLQGQSSLLLLSLATKLSQMRSQVVVIEATTLLLHLYLTNLPLILPEAACLIADSCLSLHPHTSDWLLPFPSGLLKLQVSNSKLKLVV